MRRALAAGAVLAIAFAATFALPPWSDTSVTDLPYRQAQAERLLAGELPYREQLFEYPPLAAPVLALAGLAGDRFGLALAALALVSLALVAWQCGLLADRGGGSGLAAATTAAASPLLLGAIARTQFDLVATAMLTAALALIARARPASGMAWLALGAMTKAFPIAAAAPALAWLWRARGSRAAVRGAAALAAVLALATLAAVALSFEGVAEAARYQLDRPPQIESTQASVLAAIAAVGGEPLALIPARGSVALAAPLAGSVGLAFSLATLAALAAFVALGWRAGGLRDGATATRGLTLAALGAVAALIAFGRVVSPQYMLWLVPLLALAVGWREWSIAAATAGAFVLTLAEFPGSYPALAAGESGALLLVAARNLLLVAIVALTLMALGRLARAAPPVGRV